MSVFTFFMICLNPLLVQNASSQYIRKRNTFDPVIASGMPFPPYPYSDIDMAPFRDSYYAVPAMYIPEQPYVSEYAGPVCERRSLSGADCHMSGPFSGGFGIYDVNSAFAEENVHEPSATTSSPPIKAVGFGGDELALALSPLLEAADADVALLMFTKVRTC